MTVLKINLKRFRARGAGVTLSQKAAKSLSLTVPETRVAIADQVIQ
jgi:hypothetical protein